MKKIHIISAFFGFGLTCCTPATVPQLQSIQVDAIYEDRVYEFGESIPITLKVTEEASSKNCFNIIMQSPGASITGTIDGDPIVWNEPHSIFYELMNANQASKILRLELVSQAEESAKQDIPLQVCFMAANGSEKTLQIPIRSINSAKISTTAILTPISPIKITEQATITLFTYKKNYRGLFEVTPQIEGKGNLLINGEILNRDKYFLVSSSDMITLQYQPLEVGLHTVQFHLTDNVGIAKTQTLNILVQGI